MNLLELVKSVQQIAQAAGEVIMGIYEDALGVEISKKSDDSPLTQADSAANELICKGLISLTPDIPIISEENKQIPYEERRHYDYAWLVDPLDGTKEFIKRNGEFTVNIALIHQQKVVLGVVYTPATSEMSWGVQGEGAYRVKNGETMKLIAASFSMDQPGLGVVCSRSHLTDETQSFIDALNTPNLVSKGSSLKFLVLAEGKAHIYPRLAPTMEWDTGAAQIILEEAGGQVLDNQTKAPLRYNKENLLNPYFVAYGNLQIP
jgi:3'(2'), 5'-bisphosphate nucleotidase